MLDAKADGKRLGFHVDAARMQHLEGVARAVAEREDDVIAGERLAAGERHPADAFTLGAVLDQHIGHALLEADLAAQRLDLVAHRLDHANQAESADVRLRHVENFVRRARLHKLGQHLAPQMLGVLDLAVELAVGEGARPALAELHVGFRIQHMLAPQPPGVLRALAHRLAALQHNGLEAHLRQHQRGEDAAGAEADHQRTFRQVLRRVADEVVVHVRRRRQVAVVAEFLQQRRLVFHLDVDRINHQQRVLFARIVAALENAEADKLIVRQFQALQNRRAQGFRRMVEREFEFSQSQHQLSQIGSDGPSSRGVL
jgi:hypothetical protein